MNKILIIISSLIIISCEKDDLDAYYSIENKCKLDKVEPMIYEGLGFVTPVGFDIIYNLQNQVIKKQQFFQLSKAEIEYTGIRDSLIYQNGIPLEGYFYYKSYSNLYLKHEMYTFNDSELKEISFTVYNISDEYNFSNYGLVTYEYENSNIVSSKTIIHYSRAKNHVECNYLYDGDNLIQIDEVNWSDTSSLSNYMNYQGDITFVTRKYSDYNDKLNPYYGLFLLLDFRDKSLSKNVYNNYEEITRRNSDTIGYKWTTGRFVSYFDTGLPETGYSESGSFSYFYYDCN